MQADCGVVESDGYPDVHMPFAGPARARTPTDKTAIGRQIDATDREIDRLVYELYELTDDEIRIVEEATARS